MKPNLKNSREKILEAAGELAREVGPGNLSLDAVAARAGLSKGGLLYNFPSKAKLMEALVEMHVSQNREAISDAQERHRGSPNCLARAVVETFRKDCGKDKGPPSGILAAIAEDPSFIEPVRAHQRQLVERLKRESDDAELACITFLVIEGMRCMQLFEIDALTEQESDAVLARLAELVETQSRSRPGQRTITR
jgi:AcrR family transcriptional regulator